MTKSNNNFARYRGETDLICWIHKGFIHVVAVKNVHVKAVSAIDEKIWMLKHQNMMKDKFCYYLPVNIVKTNTE